MVIDLPLKRFILMAGQTYYACGGFEDFVSSHETEAEALQAMERWLEESGSYVWAHIADTHTGELTGKG